MNVCYGEQRKLWRPRLKASRKLSNKWRVSNFPGKETRMKMILNRMFGTEVLTRQNDLPFARFYWLREGKR